MGKSPANTDERKMSDVALAREYVADIGGKGRVKQIIGNCFDALNRKFPKAGWTERRVRSFWNGEAATVSFSEMLQLHKTAEAVKVEQELIRQARREHAEFKERTARLASLLERQDEDFHRESVEGLHSGMGGMDRPRDR